MTTTFPTDNRTILNEADSTTGWTASATLGTGTSDPTPAESTNWLAMAVSSTTENAYRTITSDDYSGGGSLAVWIMPRGAMDSVVNGGVQIIVGDGTNRIGYHVGGDDGTGFRHEDGPVRWENYLLDLANKPATYTIYAGSEASLNEAAITQIGVAFKTLAKAPGGAVNCFWDIIRFADNADDVVLQGGTTSGAAGNMSEAAAVDRAGGDQQAYGVVRQLGTGLYSIQGNLTIGNASSASDQYWEETNAAYAWEDRGLSSNNYYRLKLIGSNTATNCEFSFTASTFTVPAAASASFDGNGADITSCTVTGCTFTGFDQGIETSDDTGDDWTGNTYIDTGQVTANGCDLTGSTFNGYVGTADTGVLAYNLAVDPDGELDDCVFDATNDTNACHAIEFGTSIPASITLRGCTFTGYNGSHSQNDSTLYFADTSGTITVNLVDCTGTVTYKSAGATIDLVVSPVTTKFTVKDADGTVIENARVIAETADNGGGSGFPYESAISPLTQTSGTANATSGAPHGLATNDYVVVRGAQPDGYNKVAQITVVSPTIFTYTVDSGLSSPATGTIIFSYCPIGGELTSALGVVSSSRSWPASQGLKGWARKKNTSSPFYKDAEITVADASGGTDQILVLQPDE